MKKVLESLKICFSAFFVAAFCIFLLELPDAPRDKNAGRSLASIDTNTSLSIAFLSKKQLFSLNKKDRHSYLQEVAQILTKAKSISKVVKTDSLFFNQAFAEVVCKIQGLHPAVRKTREGCDRPAKGIYIDSDTTDKFDEDYVKTNDQGDTYISCPEGKFMCTPVLLGFDFNSSSKARLRCLEEASNENCLELDTDGDQMGESLELMDEANPKFWEEFSEGINSLCKNNRGDYHAEDDGCEYIRVQMKHAHRNYASKLSLDFKNASEGMDIANLKSSSIDSKACKEEEIDADENLNAFNRYGVKFVKTGDHCYRVPAGVKVKEEADGSHTYFTQNDSGERVEEIQLSMLKNSSDGFYFFNCGPCNNKASVENCVEELSKEESERGALANMTGRNTMMPFQDCQALFSDLRDLEINEDIQEQVDRQNRRSFWETHSIE